MFDFRKKQTKFRQKIFFSGGHKEEKSSKNIVNLVPALISLRLTYNLKIFNLNINGSRHSL